MAMASTYQTDPPMADGRFYVTERHIDDKGRIYSHTYVCAQHWSPEEIMQMLAARILDAIARAESSLGYTTVTPWTKKEFWLRVTPQEYKSCKTLSKNDDTAEYYWEILQSVQTVTPGDPVLVAGMQYYASKGAISIERAKEIAGVV